MKVTRLTIPFTENGQERKVVISLIPTNERNDTFVAHFTKETVYDLVELANRLGVKVSLDVTSETIGYTE